MKPWPGLVDVEQFPPGTGGELLGELSQDVAGASTVATLSGPPLR